ncbi:MATE family efflux transporter [bacterium]|nr:MATE family efflux transporter [bacterium]
MELKHVRKTLVLGSPLILGLFSEYLMYIIDSAMVGRLGSLELAAIGIAVVYSEILWLTIWGIAPGTQSVVSRLFGQLRSCKTRKDRLAAYFNIGSTLDNAILVSLIIFSFSFLIASLAEPILGMVLVDKELMRLSYSYISIIKWCLPFGAMYFAMYGFLAAINRTKTIMVTAVSLNIVNAILNYGLIFGNFGLPKLGIKGAALGTVIAYSLTSFFLLLFILSFKPLRRYHCFRFRLIRKTVLMEILRVSAPVAMQLGIALSVYLLYEAMISHMGNIYLAATHIVFISLQINKTIVGGLAEGGSILIGNALGRGDRKNAKSYAHATELIAIGVGTPILILALVFPELIVRIFNSEPEMIEVGSMALRFFAGFFFIETLGFSFEIIFTHNGWGKFVLTSEIITNLVFVLGLTFILINVFNLGIFGAWTAFGLYLVCHSGVLMIGFMSGKWLTVKIT